jgi:hypothetical protein
MVGERVLRVFASELSVLVDEALAWPSTETGGELFGLWSHGDSPTVFLASRPGAGAEHAVTRFQQALDVHMALERLAWDRFGLQVVGIWHSHHQLRLNHLSEGDIARTMSYASNAGRRRFCEVLAWHGGGRVGLRPWVYTDAPRGAAAPSRIEVIPGESPIRAALRALPDALKAPLQAARGSGAFDLLTSSGLSPRVQAPPPPSEPELDRLAEVIPKVIPALLQEHVELVLPRDGAAVMRVDGPRGRRLRVWFDTRPALAVRRWEVVDASLRPGELRATPASDTLSVAAGADVHRAVAAGVRALLAEDR